MARREHGPGAVDAGDHRPAAHDRALVRDRERVLVVERRVLDAHRDIALGQAGFVDAANRGAKAGVVLLEQQGLEHRASPGFVRLHAPRNDDSAATKARPRRLRPCARRARQGEGKASFRRLTPFAGRSPMLRADANPPRHARPCPRRPGRCAGSLPRGGAGLREPPDETTDPVLQLLAEQGFVAEPLRAADARGRHGACPRRACCARCTTAHPASRSRRWTWSASAIGAAARRPRPASTAAASRATSSRRAWASCCRGAPTSRRRLPGLVAVKREDLRPGDLVFFNTLKRTFSHVGIYIGDNRFIHSPRPGKNVRTEDMSFAYWAKRFTGARRVETTAAVEPALAAPVPAVPDRRRLISPRRSSGLDPRRHGPARHNRRMSAKVIAVADHRYRASAPLIPARIVAPTGELRDSLHRPLRDLRISVTDRCNFRCSYCMPKEVFDRDYSFLPQSSLLSFEEIVRARAPVRRPRRAEDPPHRRRAAAAPRPRAAGRDAGRAPLRRRQRRSTSR